MISLLPAMGNLQEAVIIFCEMLIPIKHHLTKLDWCLNMIRVLTMFHPFINNEATDDILKRISIPWIKPAVVGAVTDGAQTASEV